jgi:trans-aconitate methyltransferase
MSSRATIKALIDAATAPYLSTGYFHYFRARGKLRMDPVFGQILAEGLLANAQRILDLGCGQGLLAAWLLAARACQSSAGWPREWPVSPSPVSIRGIDLMAGEVARARSAWGHSAQFETADIRAAPLGNPDAVVILDVLHYLPYDEQVLILERVHAALASEGVLLIRVADARKTARFAIGKCVDLTVMLTHYRRRPRLFCRSLSDWIAVLAESGFACRPIPMSAGTPFANVVLVARPRDRVRVPGSLTELLTA